MDDIRSNTAGSDTQRNTGLVGKLRDGAAARLNDQKERATEGLGSVAQAARQTTQQLRDQRHETVAQYIEQAADQIERFSNRLKDKNVGDLLHDAQDLARRQPAIFVGSAFALGLLGARFFKSSSEAGRRIDGGDRSGAWRQSPRGEDHLAALPPGGPAPGSTLRGGRLDDPGAERF